MLYVLNFAQAVWLPFGLMWPLCRMVQKTYNHILLCALSKGADVKGEDVLVE